MYGTVIICKFINFIFGRYFHELNPKEFLTSLLVAQVRKDEKNFMWYI